MGIQSSEQEGNRETPSACGGTAHEFMGQEKEHTGADRTRIICLKMR